jgi:hypothetical protein
MVGFGPGATGPTLNVRCNHDVCFINIIIIFTLPAQICASQPRNTTSPLLTKYD